MPYQWTETGDHRDHKDPRILRLWPYQSLRPKGYVGFVAITAAFLSLPLLALLGTGALWGLLPFLIFALVALIYALDRNRRDNQITETLDLGATDVILTRHNPRGQDQVWTCNRYWVRVDLHDDAPVPNYLTLSGNGRTVEIGAFLSEEERQTLCHELRQIIPVPPSPSAD